MRMPSRPVGAALLLFTTLLLALPLGPIPARADEDPAPGDSAPGDAPAPEDAPAPKEDAPAADEAPRLDGETPDVTKLYVPFRDLEKIFEKEGEGVFLPYEEFRRLWSLANRMPEDTSKPPVPATVRSATYRGQVEGETIRFEAQVEVEVLASGWQRVPLNYAGIGVETATIDGKPALLVPTKNGYDLLLEDAGRRTLDLVLRAGAPAKGDTHVTKFSIPPVPLARMTLRVPGNDTEVNIAPRLASTTKSAGGNTELLAFLGPVSSVELSWRRKPEDTPTVDPLVFAEETVDVRIDRGVVRSTFQAELSIRRAPISQVEIAVPKEAVVLYVNGEGIRTWTRNDEGNRIRVALRAPVREKYALQVGLERALPPPPVAAVLPIAAVEGMERERGFLRVQAADGVKIEPGATSGLVQIDLHDLPKALQGAIPGRAFAYRFPARPGECVFDVQALEPRVSASHGNRIGIRPESIDLRCVAHVTVERAGIFGLAFDVPADLEISDVAVQGAQLDDWTLRREDGKPSVLNVALRDRLLGRATVTIHGRSRISISETDGAPPLQQQIPIVLLRGAHHVRGYVGLHIEPALDHEVRTSEGLTPLDVGAPAACEPPALPGEAARLPLVYRFEHREGDVSLTMDLKRKAPTVTCQVESYVRLEPGRTQMGARLRYVVQFRGVRTFRFTAPMALAKRLHLDVTDYELIGPSGVEVKPEGAPDDWQATTGEWTVRLPAPRTGDVTIDLVIDDQPEAELKSGDLRRTEIPSFVPLAMEGKKPLPNTIYNVAVRRDALLEVDLATVEGGEEIDARELPPGLQNGDNFLAFRSYAPVHALAVDVTKHDYEALADLVVSHMHLDTLVPVEGRATTEAFLVVRNNARQYLELRLPEGASIRGVRVADRSSSPRVGENGTVLIPLISDQEKDQAFLVALYYDHDVERSGAFFEDVRLVTPEPIDAQSDILTWRVIVPGDRQYTSFGGSVDRVAPYRSWAVRTLDRLSSILVSENAAGRSNVHQLIASFTSPFTKRQHKRPYYEFQGRVGTGDVRITSVSPSFFLFWKLVLFVIAFFVARLCVSLGRGLGMGPAMVFSVLFLVLLAWLIPAGPGMTQMVTSMLFGVLLAGFFVFCGWMASGRRAALAAREAIASPGPEDEPPGGDTPPSTPAGGAADAGASAAEAGAA